MVKHIIFSEHHYDASVMFFGNILEKSHLTISGDLSVRCL